MHVQELVTLWNTLAGSAQIITNGVKTIPKYRDANNPDGELTPGGSGPYSNSNSWYDAVNARTVIGLSQDKQTLFLFTVDATPGGTSGMKVGEAADLLINDYGVYNALNLDGGGSTTLAMEDPSTHMGVIKNVSSDNPLGRSVGSNFAVFARAAVGIDYALAANGGTAIGSTTYSSGGYPAASAINGDRTGNSWGSGTGGWNDATRNTYPDMLEVDFPSAKMIDEINVFTLQNNWKTAGEPTLTTSATGEGILDFDLQTWDGTAWVAISGCSCSVTGNDKAWRQFLFPPITTTKIRVVVNNARNNWSRIVELEAIGSGGQ